MNRQTFFGSFGHIADAPGGIDKLRRLIFDLAMRGLLTERDGNDEAASELLVRARSKKARQIELGQIRRPKSYPALDASDYPHDLPDGWEWCRVVDLIHTVNGRAFKPSEWTVSGRPIIRIQNLNNPDAPFNHFAGDVDDAHLVAPGDLLISWSGTPGTSFGAFVWRGTPGVLNQHIFKCGLFDDYRDFICLAVNSRLDVLIGDAHGGVGLQHFTKDKLERLALPIPPLQEQRRIVARVDDLMMVCDELREQQESRTEVRSALTAATLHRVSDAISTDDLLAAISSFAEDIDLHLAVGDGDRAALKRVRQSILDLAVRGRLAHQDPADEPAVELLDQIAVERARLVKAKEIRKPKKFAKVPDRDSDPDLPSGWVWARANEFFIASDSGWSPRCLPEPAAPGEWGVLKTSAVSRGVFDQYENKKLPATLEPRPQLEVLPGDFVMIRASGSKTLVGRGAIVTEKESRLMLSDKHIRLSFLHEASTRFWAILNDSSAVQSYYSDESSGTSTMSNVTRDRIGALLVAVPPLAEQLRIAESVDKLLGLCDELEQRLLTAEVARIDLAASVVAHATPQREAGID